MHKKPKIWLTANLNLGSHLHWLDELNPRYTLYSKEHVDDIILANINSNVEQDDLFIVVGNLLGNSIDLASQILCKNKICVASEKDLNNSHLIRPYFDIVDDLRIGEVVICHDYNTCKEITHRDHLSICGSPNDLWKVNGNSVNVTVDLWNLMPVELNTVIRKANWQGSVTSFLDPCDTFHGNGLTTDSMW